MPIRHPVKTAFGSALAIAILTAPGIVSAQSLFGAPAPAATATPAASTPPAKPAAAPAPAKKPVTQRKPRKPVVPTDASVVDVTNKRVATLVELSVTSTTAKDAKPQIIAHDLKSGEKVSTKLAKKGGCTYDVSGTFDDDSTLELSALDLCKDNSLNLVE